MSTEVTNQIADLGPDIGIFVQNEGFKFSVDVCSVDSLVEVFGNSGKLGD